MKLPALLLAGFLVLTSSIPAHAHFMMPTAVPVDRIVKNTEALLAKKPGDTELRYQLGRVHYLAFALKKASLETWARNEPPTAELVSPRNLQGFHNEKRPELDAETAVQHAARAAELFQQVLEKDSNHALAHLGLGSLLEQFAEESAKNPPKQIPTSLTRRDGATIRQHYAAAFAQTWEKERKAKERDVDGLASFVSYEAAQSYLRSAKADARSLTDEEKKNVRQMSDAVKKLEALPPGPITPLIFSFQPASSITSLLAPECSVAFDLRGFGRPERWSWLQAETGILVWDPAGGGRITSARQMFGSYTWQLFWRSGFDALAALDDDHDGWLRGAELDGLSVWRDRNQNAVSEPGEVTPLGQLGITALACSAPENEGPHPLHRHGVKLKDGHALPLWDWITSPLPSEPAAVASRK